MAQSEMTKITGGLGVIGLGLYAVADVRLRQADYSPGRVDRDRNSGMTVTILTLTRDRWFS